MIARLRSLPDRVWDFALSAGLLFFLVGDVVAGSFDGTAFVPCFACVLVISLLPLVRRRAPLATIYAWTIATAVLGWGLEAADNFIDPILGLFIFPYNAGLRAPGRRGFAALPAIWVTAAAAALTDPSGGWGDLVFPGVFGTLFWLVRRAVASRSHLSAELHWRTRDRPVSPHPRAREGDTRRRRGARAGLEPRGRGRAPPDRPRDARRRR